MKGKQEGGDDIRAARGWDEGRRREGGSGAGSCVCVGGGSGDGGRWFEEVVTLITRE